MKKLFLFLWFLLPCFVFSQNPVSIAANQGISSSVFDSGDTSSVVAHLPFENIGPTVFSGRVADLAVNPDDPTHFYVAYASGGLWKTINNGTTFTPIFDHEDVMTIGALAVNWEDSVIWVGTGEVNSSRSSYAGVGMYKSLDDGASWEYFGLPESHHIGKILLDPFDAGVAWVAVLGHLYTTNPERGVYKTIDGGHSWQHVLAINDSTGVVDLVADPEDSAILYAAAWERDRKAWNFTEAGPGSGIYKSLDSGETWSRVSVKGSGFPHGERVGRIGLAIAGTGGNQKIYALLDNYNRREKEEKDPTEDLVKDDFKEMTVDQFMELEDERLGDYLRSNRFPRKYSAKSVKKMMEDEKIGPADLAYFLENANSLLFDTPVIGAELYVSEDGGENWKKTHEDYLDGVYFSYGYYFGVISADPGNPDQVYIAGVPILSSTDGGKSFESINGANVHVDHHKIWVNPAKPGHLINGNDGGVNISYDNGENWIKCNSPSVGQFYYINVDDATPYRVYGGTQDNGVWMGEHTYSEGVRWHSTGQYPYKGILGGDGMQVQIDKRDNVTVYSGSQFGNYFRLNTETGQRTRITPIHELGERPYRWNWQSPIHLSVHNQDIVYFGAHILFRSLDKGEHFIPISEDLTQGGKTGDVAYGTLSSIHESPLKFGMIYTGSDDGLVHLSPDGGNSWKNIGLPEWKDLWVSRIQASSHQEGRVYVSLNGYRNDDFRPYLYISHDYGQNWTNIGSGLPDEPINVVKEDPVSETIVYIGTDRASYVSLDSGTSFTRFREGLTSAPVHDLVVQEKAKDLLIGTHGRSIYRTHIGHLQELASRLDEPLIVFAIPDQRYSDRVGSRFAFYQDYRTNDLTFTVYTNLARKADLQVKTEDGQVLYQRELDLPLGISDHTYDLGLEAGNLEAYKAVLKEEAKKLKEADNGKYYLLPGKFSIELAFDDKIVTQKFEITD